jgi:dUTP pyrophosphatase
MVQLSIGFNREGLKMTNQDIQVQIQRLENAKDLPLPSYGSDEAAGMDLYAANSDDIVLQKGKRTIVPTGYAIALPRGFEAQIRPRSGLAIKNGLIVVNSPGTVDSDYRGEVGVIIANIGDENFTIERGMRIAQMVVTRHDRVAWQEVSELGDTQRGAGGFGSTGVVDRKVG